MSNEENILQQLVQMTKIMVTRDDIKNFATKDDLKNFATKDDLKNIESRIRTATKDDINLLIIRIDNLSDQFGNLKGKQANMETRMVKLELGQTKLDTATNKIIYELLKIRDRLSNLAENMVTKADLIQINSHIEGFVRLHTNLDQEQTALRSKTKRIEDRVEILEMKLES